MITIGDDLFYDTQIDASTSTESRESVDGHGVREEISQKKWANKFIGSFLNCVREQGGRQHGRSSRDVIKRATPSNSSLTLSSFSPSSSTAAIFKYLKSASSSVIIPSLTNESRCKSESSKKEKLKYRDKEGRHEREELIRQVVERPEHELLWAMNGVCVKIFLPGVSRDMISMLVKGKHVEIQAIRKNKVSFCSRVDSTENVTTGPSDEGDEAVNVMHLYKIRFRVDSRFDVLAVSVVGFERKTLCLEIPLRRKSNTE